MTRHVKRKRSTRSQSSATVAQYMSASPHSIGHDQTLEAAHAMMRTHRVRHLPVLSAGRLLGIVSQRDLYFVESLRGVDPKEVTVEEAMSQDVYRVSPDAKLETVTRTMTRQKYGSAVVMDHERVVGIFTTVDALRALTGLLGARQATKSALAALL